MSMGNALSQGARIVATVDAVRPFIRKKTAESRNRADDAEDVYQETVLRLIERSGPDIEKPEEYAMAVVCNFIATSRKQANRERPLPADWELMCHRTARLDESHGNRWGIHLMLEEALGTLTRRDRIILERHHLGGWTRAELARQFRLTVDGVKSCLARTKRYLRNVLQQNGFPVAMANLASRRK